MTKSVKYLLLVILLIMGTGLFLMASFNSKEVQQLPMVGEQFPSFQMTQLNQMPITEQIFVQQTLTLVNVWASWCGICKLEHDFLLNLQQQDINIIGLNYRDNINAANNELSATGNPYSATIYDPKGELALKIGVFGTPESYLVNQQGIIVQRFSGALTPTLWQKYFASHFSEQ